MNERRTGLIDVAGSRDTRSIGLLYPNSADWALIQRGGID